MYPFCPILTKIEKCQVLEILSNRNFRANPSILEFFNTHTRTGRFEQSVRKATNVPASCLLQEQNVIIIFVWAVKSPTYSAQSERVGPETVGCGPKRSTAGCIKSRKPDNGATIRLIKEYHTCIQTCISFPRAFLLYRLLPRPSIPSKSNL